MASTLIQWAANEQVKGAAIVGELAKRSAIMKDFMFIPSNRDLEHRIKMVSEIDKVTPRTIGSGVTPRVNNNKIVTYPLAAFTDIISEDIATAGTSTEDVFDWIANNRPINLQSMAQGVSYSFIYGGSELTGLKEYAIDADQSILAGGDSGSSTSIIAVRMGPTGTYGVFSRKAFREGTLIKEYITNRVVDGEVIPVNAYQSDNTVLPSIEVNYEFYAGIAVADPTSIAVYTGIQDSSHKPTAPNMDKLVDYVKGDPSNTILIMNRTSRRLLGELKNSKLQVMNDQMGVDNRVLTWNGIPIVIDENITDTE